MWVTLMGPARLCGVIPGKIVSPAGWNIGFRNMKYQVGSNFRLRNKNVYTNRKTYQYYFYKLNCWIKISVKCTVCLCSITCWSMKYSSALVLSSGVTCIPSIICRFGCWKIRRGRCRSRRETAFPITDNWIKFVKTSIFSSSSIS